MPHREPTGNTLTGTGSPQKGSLHKKKNHRWQGFGEKGKSRTGRGAQSPGGTAGYEKKEKGGGEKPLSVVEGSESYL